MQYRQGKKEDKLARKLRIGFALRLSEVKTPQHSGNNMRWFRANFYIRWRHTPSRSLFYLRCALWWFRRDSLHVSPQASATIRHNIEIFHVMLSNLMFSYSGWCSAKLFNVTLHHLCVRCTIRHYVKPFHATLHFCTYAVPFYITLSHFTQRYTVRMCAVLFNIALSHFKQLYTVCVHCTVWHYPEPFHATLYRLCLRCAIRHCAKPFHTTLHHMCVHCTIWYYAEPFDATLHCLCTVLQMSKFAVELVHFTISCSNST